MTAPSPHALAAAFVAEHLKDWLPPHGPVMVGEVRTTAQGVLVRELAALLVDYGAKVLVEHDRKWLNNHGAVLAQAQRANNQPAAVGAILPPLPGACSDDNCPICEEQQ